MKKPKPSHGGARPGSGRKTTAKKPFTIRVTQAEKDMIEKLRKAP